MSGLSTPLSDAGLQRPHPLCEVEPLAPRITLRHRAVIGEDHQPIAASIIARPCGRAGRIGTAGTGERHPIALYLAGHGLIGSGRLSTVMSPDRIEDKWNFRRMPHSRPLASRRGRNVRETVLVYRLAARRERPGDGPRRL